MLPDPPDLAVVHLRIALATLISGFIIAGVPTIYRGFLASRSSALIVFLQAFLVGRGWLALETGEEQEEHGVAERHIDTHDEAEERSLLLAGTGLRASAAGLLATAGRSAQKRSSS